MQHNILSYWQHLENSPDERPSPRVCRLMLDMFESWRTQQPFPGFDSLGHVRDHLGPADPADIMRQPVAVRRGLAMQKTLDRASDTAAQRDGFCSVHPDELVVGTMPPYSVGQGKEVMQYLKGPEDDEDELLDFEIGFLNPWSNFGHIVPNHQKVVERGLQSLIDEARAAMDRPDVGCSERAFHHSVVLALEGVIRYAHRYAELAERQATIHRQALQSHPQHPRRALFESRIDGMQAVAERLRRIPAQPCRSFLDAVQCIFLMNCALHWTGELSSLGRLDQILLPYYESDGLSFEAAQEIIDCLWVKLDERVVLDHRLLEDRFTSADGALLGSGTASNFDQGALANQWMQQITIGGIKATDAPEPEDASNDITRMCLHAARRLPLNCPTLDLRVHSNTPRDLLELAARAMLSGGAHPILLNDDKLVPALHERSGAPVALRSARNYACDGCYETVFPGETEFSFIYVPGVDALEKTLNGGAGLGSAGDTFLRGMKSSFRTPPAECITSFEHFYSILESHIWLNVNRQLRGLLRAYGVKGAICPTPILSAMIDGCLESGRDLYAGGARYHMFAPLMTGISTVADSLYVIDQLVFGQRAFSLQELVACLRTNWGRHPGVVGMKLDRDRIAAIRELCLSQPRFGHGDKTVDAYAWRVTDSFVDAIERARSHPCHAADWQRLADRFDLPGRPFEVLLTPGVGTFEQYVFGGSFGGATPDGRNAGDPLASDLAAAPLPSDQDPLAAAPSDVPGTGRTRLLDALSSWSHPSFDRFSDGAPADFNIPEDFPEKALVAVLEAFAAGKGGNIMTVTVADPETLRAAEESPMDYDLLRVRMGGWTEFFSVLSPAHKSQHRRRPVYRP